MDTHNVWQALDTDPKSWLATDSPDGALRLHVSIQSDSPRCDESPCISAQLPWSSTSKVSIDASPIFVYPHSELH